MPVRVPQTVFEDGEPIWEQQEDRDTGTTESHVPRNIRQGVHTHLLM